MRLANRMRPLSVFIAFALALGLGGVQAALAGGPQPAPAEADLLAMWTVEGPPDHIAVGPDGSVYVTINNNHRVVGYTAAGVRFTGWTYEGQAGGVAVAPDGTIFVTINNNHLTTQATDTAGPTVVGYDSSGQVVAQWSVECSECVEPLATGIAVGPYGSVFVSINNNNHREVQTGIAPPLIARYDPFGGLLSQWQVECEECETPDIVGPAVGPDGSVFVNINNSHRVLGYTLDGTGFVDWAIEDQASAIAVSPSGEVFVNINNSHKVVGYTLTQAETAGFSLGKWNVEETAGFTHAFTDPALAISAGVKIHLADSLSRSVAVYGLR